MALTHSVDPIADLFGDNDNDPLNFWKGLPIERLPVSAAAAREVGSRYFYSGLECTEGHVAPKYAVGNKCVVCALRTALDKRIKAGAKPGKQGAARAHLVRAIAVMDGKKTYTPSRPCKNGHSLRWVGTNNCVECAEEKKGDYSESRREKRLVKKYGITNEAYAEMAAAQDNCCKICEESVPDRAQFHVDHCHNTGKIRGLLCSRCNQAIGLLREDPAIIRRAAEYVENAAA